MSDALAVAVVSAVLRARIRAVADPLGISQVVTELPRDDSPPGVYLHLYQVLPNAELLNAHLPERDARGAVVRAPRLPVDLHYLVSFTGAPETHDPERLAGAVLIEFTQHPQLAPREITDVLATMPEGPLAHADLADQHEAVRVTLLPLGAEELSRTWALYGQGRHRLAVAYRVSVVMLDAPVAPVATMPVTSAPVVTVLPSRTPRIAAVRSSTGPGPVVPFGGELVVTGVALRGRRTELRVGDVTVPDARVTVDDTELRVVVDVASTVRAGVAPVQVVHPAVLASGATRGGVASNTAPVCVVPVVGDVELADGPAGSAPRTRLVRVDLAPVPGPGERVVLHLDRPDGGPGSTWGDPEVADGVTVFTTVDLPAGDHQVRVAVGGAMSLPAVDPGTGTLVLPTVTVP